MCVCKHVCARVCVPVCVHAYKHTHEEIRGSLAGVGSFPQLVVPGGLTQVIRLRGKCRIPLSHLISPTTGDASKVTHPEKPA